MITGVIEPSKGTVIFNCEPIQRNALRYKQQFGYVPEKPYLYSHLTGLEYVTIVAESRDLPRKRTDEKISALLRLFSLHADRHLPLSSYSKGMRPKILHELKLVERVCSHVVILHGGRVVADASIESLRTLMALPTLEMIFSQLAVEQDSEAISRQIADLILA